jgi:hypothetical protein
MPSTMADTEKSEKLWPIPTVCSSNSAKSSVSFIRFASFGKIADEIAASYPFHPSFKHILALFKENERFRQTRGLMTMAPLTKS